MTRLPLDPSTLAFWNPRRVLDRLGRAPDDRGPERYSSASALIGAEKVPKRSEATHPALSANAQTVLARRYLARDARGRLAETADGLFRRVAGAVSAAEPEAAARFHDMMSRLEFLPNSPTLMNAARPLGNLAACFTLPVGDSLPSIFEAVKNTAIIQQTGGGVGFSFSRLRPAGDIVASTHGVASGPVSFMDVFDKATETIKQGGTRRGAMMGILAVDHPDILAFITAKADLARLTNFNVSVGLTDAFMRAVEDDADYALRNPRTGEPVSRLRARKVWDLVCNLAWATAEPGVLFADRIERENPTPHAGALEATNPCSELPLLPYESCVLGSLNLARFVAPGARELAWDHLRARVRDAVRFLDDVIDASRYPLPEIATATRANRKVGLGVMGFADLLAALAIPYDSEEALELADRVMGAIAAEARSASEALAKERGAFPNFFGSALAEDGAPPRRNATLLAIAPTGTLSILAGCSGGIEPIFALAYFRRILDGQELEEVHPLFAEAARREGLDARVIEEVARTGSARRTPGVPERLAAIFPTAYDVAPTWHVRMQAAFQKHVDNAVSKTVNLPREATPADVAEVFRLAYGLGCKGVTVYRDGSRAAQVLNVGARIAAPERASGERCPDCRAGALETSGGCAFCRSCGWSRCG